MKKSFLSLLATLPLALGAPALMAAPKAPVAASHTRAAQKPVTILISIDGFRPDYLQRGVTPNLNALAAKGISAAMRPSFPSKTFPNHTTLVTGLVPDHNGIVANSMFDKRRPGEKFTMSTEDAFWWAESEPVWIAAEKAGIRTATMFWPGANVEHDGLRPQDWQQFSSKVTGGQRVNGVLDWLRRPASIRPAFVTLYFDTVDTAGHDFGPDAAETTKAVAEVDARIGDLVKGIKALGLTANLVVVADHGMAAVSQDRTVLLPSFLNPQDYTVVEDGPFASLNPVAGHEAALEASLSKAPEHVQCWPKRSIPARFRYGSNPRVPEVLCLADSGWEVLRDTPKKPVSGGTHGYDNAAPDMAALFIASGPAFKARGQIPAFDNTAIEPMLRDVLGLPQGSSRDGMNTIFVTLRK
jgi:predicted AlkP superfamily pyrophosphatase or phosphodiesterase